MSEVTSSTTSGSFNGGNVLNIDVGGVTYTTCRSTLTREPNSLLAELFSTGATANGRGGSNATDMEAGEQGGCKVARDSKGRFFIDRDGVLFRYVLDYLRNQKLVLPECFLEKERLKQEAEYFRLPGMIQHLNSTDVHVARITAPLPTLRHLTPSPTHLGGGYDAPPHSPLAYSGDNVSPSALGGPSGGWRTLDAGHITVGYRGTFSFGRDGGQADVKFRKLWRILVSGKVALCREVFRDTLNESRDVDRGTSDRYSARFFLKHTFIEQAFDALQEAGFRLVGSAGSGTNSGGDTKPGMDTEECKWNHYNEFVFCR